VLAGTETVSDLAAQHGVSRKFVYAQTGKARAALDDAFLAASPQNDVLFNLAVTKTWLHQVIVALPLICHSSYRGVIEFIVTGASSAPMRREVDPSKLRVVGTARVRRWIMPSVMPCISTCTKEMRIAGLS
jgi:hypothetical protein